METKSQLPTLVELCSDLEVAFKNDQLNLLLNQPPPANWIKQHPFAKNVKYMPIDKVELLLTKIFQEWRAEIIDYRQLFNSVACHVRLHYKNPITNAWSFHDGVGAVGIQTDKGAAASDLAAIKSDAVMKALPAAKSYAIKDAADHLGALFGRDLNRKDTIAFTGSYTKPDGTEDFSQIEDQLQLITTLGELNSYWEQMPEYHSTKEFQKLFSIQKNKIIKP